MHAFVREDRPSSEYHAAPVTSIETPTLRKIQPFKESNHFMYAIPDL